VAPPRAKADPFGDVLGDVESGDLRPVYLLGGQEAFLVRRAHDLLVAASVAGGPRGFNEQVFTGEKARGDAVVAACNTLPMMGKRRTVVVRGVEKLKKDDQDALADYCASPCPSTVLLLLESDEGKGLDGRTKLPKNIRKSGRACDFRRLYGRDLAGFVQAEARRAGKQMEPAAPGFLEALLGNDLSQIANAIDVAALYVGDERRVTLADLEEVVAGRKQDALWDLLDAVGLRSTDKALRALQLLAGNGEDAHGTLRLLTKRVRELQRARLGLDEGMNVRDAALAAGIPPNLAWKFDEPIRAWRAPHLAAAVARMLRAESDMKGGLRVEPRLALEAAVLDLLALPG